MATLQKLEFDFVKHFKVELYSEKRWKKGAGKNKQVLDEDEANEIYEKSMKFLEKIDELHQPKNDTHVQYDSSYNDNCPPIMQPKFFKSTFLRNVLGTQKGVFDSVEHFYV